MKKFAICFVVWLAFQIIVQAQSFNLINQKTLGSSSEDNPVSIIQTLDGGYLVSVSSNGSSNGDKSCMNFGEYDVWICKLNSSLNVEWQNCFGGNSIEMFPFKIIEGSSGYSLFLSSISGVSGNKTLPYLIEPLTNTPYTHIWVVSLDFNGNILNQFVYGGEKGASISDVVKYNNGYLCLGSINGEPGYDLSSSTHGANDYWLLYLDSNMNKVWDKTIGGLDHNYGSKIIIY